MAMTQEQKSFCAALLEKSRQHGQVYFPVQPIADAIGITEPMFDGANGEGVLYEISQFGNGYIYIIDNNGEVSAQVTEETRDMLELWCRN